MPKPKKVPYRLITDDGNGKLMYRMLRELVSEHHSHLTNARISLAWHNGWKPDVDGYVKLGQCRKASDLDRQLHQFDFVILLNRQFWTEPGVTDEQRTALLDHELCHAEVALDDHKEPKEDETGHTVYRMRRHDLEEFSEIAERYGCWKKDIEQFYSALKRSKQGKLDLAIEKAAKPQLKKGEPVGDEARPH